MTEVVVEAVPRRRADGAGLRPALLADPATQRTDIANEVLT